MRAVITVKVWKKNKTLISVMTVSRTPSKSRMLLGSLRDNPMVTVRYLSYLKIAAGIKEEEVELSDTLPAGEVIRKLAERHGGDLKDRLITQGGGLKVVFSINGEKSGEDAELVDGDVLTVMPPLAGG